jgi:hypothetical protein
MMDLNPPLKRLAIIATIASFLVASSLYSVHAGFGSGGFGGGFGVGSGGGGGGGGGGTGASDAVVLVIQD